MKLLFLIFFLCCMGPFCPLFQLNALTTGDLDLETVPTGNGKGEYKVAPAPKESGNEKSLKSGQTSKTFLEKIGTIKVRTFLNFRKEPWGSKIGRFYNNQEVTIVGREGDWYKVTHNGKTGYVHSNYVVMGKSGNPPKGTPDEGSGNQNTDGSETPTDSGDPSEKVTLKGGGVEVKGIQNWSQNKTDPYDPKGGKGWRPSGYCGPTSLQKVLSFYGIKASRDYLALTRLGSKGEVLQTNYKSSSFRGQMYAMGSGSAYGPMVNMAKHMGFKKTEMVHNKSIRSMKERLVAGRPLIVSVKGYIKDMNGGGYNTAGHIMVVTGVTAEGNVIVSDSAGSGKRRVIRASDFMGIWRGFFIDIKK